MLERTSHRWEDSIKIDHRRVRWVRRCDWINVAQDGTKRRIVVNAILKFMFHKSGGIFVYRFSDCRIFQGGLRSI